MIPPESQTEREGHGAADLLLGLILEELRSAASEEEERAFYRAAGARLAWRYPVASDGSLATLEKDVNGIFARLGLGTASISLASDALRIQHIMDFHGDVGRGNLHRLLPPMLEGAYDAWLHTLGSGAQLTTSIESLIDTAVTLRHGR